MATVDRDPETPVGPSYDAAMGKHLRGPGAEPRPWPGQIPLPPLLFKPLSTPYRAQKAIREGRLAAVLLTLTHLYCALIIHLRPRLRETLIGHAPLTLILANLAGALVALGLWALLLRRPRRWVFRVLACWSLLASFPLIWVYGHGSGPFAWAALACAILGLRGMETAKRQAPTGTVT